MDAVTDSLADAPADGVQPDDGSVAGWRPISQGGDCGVYLADLTKVSFPARVWTSCGEGCQASAASVISDRGSLFSASYLANVGSETYVSVRTGFTKPHARTVLEVFRLRDGKLLTALESTNEPTCSTIGAVVGPDRLWAAIGAPPSNELVGSQLLDGSAPMTFTTAPLPTLLPNVLFAFAGGYGVAGRGGGVDLLTSTSASGFASVERSGPANEPLGEGDLAVWTGSRVTAYDSIVTLRAGETPKVIYTPTDAQISGVGLSDKYLVWGEGHGPRAAEYWFTDMDVYWAARPKSSAEALVLQKGPKLAAAGAPSPFRTWGDYAAILSYVNETSDPYRLFVVQRSTGKTWTLKNRPGNVYVALLGLNESEVLIGDRVPSDDSGVIRHLVRLDLTKLDTLAAAR